MNMNLSLTFNTISIFNDFNSISGFFISIFSHCNFIFDQLGVLTSEVFYFLSYLSPLTNFNLHDLVNLSIYLASSILLVFWCFGLITITIPLISFSGRAGKILDTAAKFVVIVAGSSNLYKNHGGGSDSNDDDDKDKDKDKNKDKDADKDKQNEDKKDNETNKTNESDSDSNTASK